MRCMRWNRESPEEAAASEVRGGARTTEKGGISPPRAPRLL